MDGARRGGLARVRPPRYLTAPMDPVAFHIGRLTIRWYGVFVALGFLAGFMLVQFRARELDFEQEEAADLVLAAWIGGIVGAGVLYVVQNWTEYRKNLVEIIRIDHGGLVFYGGFLGALALLYVVSRVKSLSPGAIGDLLAPALALGHAFGRVGCFLNGCCFGHPWDGGCAVRYPPGGNVMYVQAQTGFLQPGALDCLPVFPIQLVSALVNLASCALLLWVGSRVKTRGQLFPLYLILYAVTRFAVEFGRGDYLRKLGPFTPAQAICLVLLPAGIIWLAAARRTATIGTS